MDLSSLNTNEDFAFILNKNDVNGTHYIHITTSPNNSETKFLTIYLDDLETEEGSVIIRRNINKTATNPDPVIFLKIENKIVKVV